MRYGKKQHNVKNDHKSVEKRKELYNDNVAGYYGNDNAGRLQNEWGIWHKNNYIR